MRPDILTHSGKYFNFLQPTADMVALATEQRDLMPEHDDEWESIAGLQPNALNIIPQNPWLARHRFLLRFSELMAS